MRNKSSFKLNTNEDTVSQDMHLKCNFAIQTNYELAQFGRAYTYTARIGERIPLCIDVCESGNRVQQMSLRHCKSASDFCGSH